MLKKVELYEVQDKVRVMEEFNEIVGAVNALEEKVEYLMKHLEAHLKTHHEVERADKPKVESKKKK